MGRSGSPGIAGVLTLLMPFPLPLDSPGLLTVETGLAGKAGLKTTVHPIILFRGRTNLFFQQGINRGRVGCRIPTGKIRQWRTNIDLISAVCGQSHHSERYNFCVGDACQS